MPTYRVLAWRDLPTQVEVTADDGTVTKRPMARWFMQEVSRRTMAEGLAATDDYLEAFAWSKPVARDGDVGAVLDAVVEELAAAHGRRPDGHPLREADVHGAGPAAD